MLLLHIPDRYMVFQCLTNLLVKGHLFAFYRFDHIKYCSLFARVLRRQIPPVAQHLESLGIDPVLYFYPWAQTIYLKYLPAHVAGRVWDNFLADGEDGGTDFVFRTGIAILYLLSQDIVGAPMERVMAIVQRRPSTMALWDEKVNVESTLFGAIEKIDLSTTTRLSIQQANGNVFEYHPTYMVR